MLGLESGDEVGLSNFDVNNPFADNYPNGGETMFKHLYRVLQNIC